MEDPSLPLPTEPAVDNASDPMDEVVPASAPMEEMELPAPVVENNNGDDEDLQREGKGEGKRKEKIVRATQRADITLPPPRFKALISQERGKGQVSTGSAVFLAGATEKLLEKIVEGAAVIAEKQGRKRVTTQAIAAYLKSPEGAPYNAMLGNAIIPEGGNADEDELLPKKKRSREESKETDAKKKKKKDKNKTKSAKKPPAKKQTSTKKTPAKKPAAKKSKNEKSADLKIKQSKNSKTNKTKTTIRKGKGKQ